MSPTRGDEDDVSSRSHPEDLPADVGDPLLLQRVPFGVFDQIRYRAGPTELHHQLQTHTNILTDQIIMFFLSTSADPDCLEE